MGLHPWLRGHAARGALFLVYGPPGSGKTSITLEILRFAEDQLGLNSCLVATETGTLLAVRHSAWAPRRVVESYTLDSLPVRVVDCVRGGGAVAVDSANSLYRLEGGGMAAGSIVSFVSALLRSRAEKGAPMVMTAQVSMDGTEVPAWAYMAPWASVILRLEHRGGRRVAAAEKPERMIMEFMVKDGGVLEWI